MGLHDALTDEQCLEALKAVWDHGSRAKAAVALGLHVNTLKNRLTTAESRGLTYEGTPGGGSEKEIARFKKKLSIAEKTLAAINRENDTAETIRKTIYSLSELTPDPPKWINKSTKHGAPGVPMVMFSDWHYGERVFKDEVGGVNEFNHDIADQRITRLVDTTVSLARDYMVNPSYPGIVVCLGGDLISGNIHEELRETNEGPVAVSLLRLQERLISALLHLADVFGKVFVPCVVGNHGRMKLKPHAKHKVFENFEWNLYCQLERFLRNDKRFQFFIPGETDAHFTVLGHRFLLTHGDSLGVRGGDGIIGALGPITRGAIKVGRSEAQIGRDFDTIVMGHWHTYIPRGEAAPVIVNGALKGYDEYARLFLRVPYSRPSQAMWFVHEEHGITAQWQIFLDKRRASAENGTWVSWMKD